MKDSSNTDISAAAWEDLAINIVPLSAGDIDGSMTVNLQDAIIALQIASGIRPERDVYKAGDVNGDGKIGIEEAIYVLQLIAQLR